MWGELAPPTAPQSACAMVTARAYFNVSRTDLAAATMLRREATTSG
jgi:hypothetical protein